MKPTTLILCGGRGTRARPYTNDLPKPLIEVAGVPILRHVMDVYADQGARRFVLAAGFRAELIETFARALPESWDVTVVDTGEDTHKGDRVLACRHLLDESFYVTYGDGVGNVDIDALTSFHEQHGGAATVTVVPLPSQYGTIEFDDSGCVDRFLEKPRLRDHWINAGFMVMEPRVFEDWSGGDLETDVLPHLARRHDLFAFRHEGFWKSMDTYQDAQDLTSLAEEAMHGRGKPPWSSSPAHASS